MNIFKKTTNPDGTTMCVGAIILSVFYQEGKENDAVMLVGRKEKGKNTEIVNVYAGESVIAVLNTLANGKEITDILKNHTKN